MPIEKKPQLTAWSYSRLTTYEGCPLKAKLKFIQKLKEPPSPALDRGRVVHDDAEHYVDGTIKKRPKSLDLFPDEFKKLRAMYRKGGVKLEAELAFDENFDSCDWFGHDAWLRVKLDVMYPGKNPSCMKVKDHKTGKIREENVAQLELYALGVFCKFPEIEVVDSDFWYLDQGEIISRTYLRADLKGIKQRWIKRSKPLLMDKTFKAAPGNACRWCHFGKEKGGPCKF